MTSINKSSDEVTIGSQQSGMTSIHKSSDEVTIGSQQSGMTSIHNSSDEVIIESQKYETISVHKSSDEVTIESKKSGETSVNKSSEEYKEYYCDPCKNVDDYAEAEGFCTDCKEYLCSTCFRAHSRSNLSKHHILLGRDDMPRKYQSFCNPCKRSGDEIQAVGYCDDCCTFLCENCYKNHQRNNLTKNHVIVKTVEAREGDVTTSVAKINIKGRTSGGLMTNEEYTYVRDINAKSKTDDRECYITNMALVSKNELVLSDNDNKCLKLVDIDKNVIKDVSAVQFHPLGITTISNDQIAVVLYRSHQIQIVTARGKLTLDRIIKTNGYCVNVEMINKHLYVSFEEPVKFQILQPTGAIIKTITPDAEVLKHCTFPAYIAVNPDESAIYLSDWKTNKVLSLDMNGNMIALYKEELDGPEGIIISPSGSVYVCNGAQHIVYKMKSDLSEVIVILGPGDELEYPHAICLDTDYQHFYISSGSTDAYHCDSLKVFNCCIETSL